MEEKEIMNAMDKLTALLSNKKFYMDNKDLKDPAEIIAAIQKEVPEATAEEIDELLTCVSEMVQRNDDELREEELEMVSGGSVAGAIAAVGGAVAIIQGIGWLGSLIGETIWNWKHSKCYCG